MITLTPEQEKLVAQAVGTGAYSSTGEVLTRALELLRAQDEWLLENKSRVEDRIELAAAQMDRGEGIGPRDLTERLAQRKKDWLEQHDDR